MPSNTGVILEVVAETGGGSSVSTAVTVSAAVRRRNGLRPVSISYSTTPKEKMSLRASTGWPRVCSGDM